MKNFKLLLSGVAAISLATIAANAEVGDSLSSAIEIHTYIIDPAMIKPGLIDFPVITTAGGRVVTVDANGNIVRSGDYATTAHTLGDILVEPIVISGGDVGNVYDSYLAGNDADINFIVDNVTVTTPITVTDQSRNDSGECGTVDNFTAGTPYFSEEAMAENTEPVRVVKIPYGATFTMKEGFRPNNGRADCVGSATVTYVPYNF